LPSRFFDILDLSLGDGEHPPEVPAQTTDGKDVPQIKGATLTKLVERVTSEKFSGILITSFFLTF